MTSRQATGSSPAYLLKPFSGSLPQLEQLHAHHRTLEEHQYAHIPHWRVTMDGAPWIASDGKLLYATTWIAGRPLTGEPADLRLLGAALADLHQLSARLLAKDGERLREARQRPLHPRLMQRLWRQQRGYQNRLNQLRGQQNLSLADAERVTWLLLHEDDCRHLAADAWRTLSGESGKRTFARENRHPALTHGDVTRPNVMISGRHITLVDWERCGIGSPCLELAKCLANTTDFRWQSITALLAGYERQRPLCADDRRVVAALFRLPREAWSCASEASHRGHRQSDMLPVLQATWEHRLRAVQRLDKWALQGSAER